MAEKTYQFPSDLGSRQQGHYMKIQIFPSKIGSEKDTHTIFLFVPGGNQNGPLQWEMNHEYDDVKLARLGTGVVGAITRMLPGGSTAVGLANRLSGPALAGARIAGLGTINPKVDVLYGNSELRVFNFSFFMSPQSKKETEDLKNIVKTLRKFSAPEIATLDQISANLPPGQLRDAITGAAGDNFNSASGQGSQLKSGLWFIPPAEFLISFHSIVDNGQGAISGKENQYLPKIGRSVLSRINVDYTQQGDFSTFTDGAPTNLQLTMSFREMRIISQNDVDNGY